MGGKMRGTGNVRPTRKLKLLPESRALGRNGCRIELHLKLHPVRWGRQSRIDPEPDQEKFTDPRDHAQVQSNRFETTSSKLISYNRRNINILLYMLAKSIRDATQPEALDAGFQTLEE